MEEAFPTWRIDRKARFEFILHISSHSYLSSPPFSSFPFRWFGPMHVQDRSKETTSPKSLFWWSWTPKTCKPHEFFQPKLELACTFLQIPNLLEAFNPFNSKSLHFCAKPWVPSGVGSAPHGLLYFAAAGTAAGRAGGADHSAGDLGECLAGVDGHRRWGRCLFGGDDLGGFGTQPIGLCTFF